MAAKRLNITLPEDVMSVLNENAKEGERASFIARSILAYAKQLQRRRLQEELRAGYIASAREAKDLTNEFDAILMDGLDED